MTFSIWNPPLLWFVMVLCCIQTLSILSRGKSSWTFSGPMKYCSVTCQCVRVIWYFISSTRAGVEAIRTLPGWWRPTAYTENVGMDDVCSQKCQQSWEPSEGPHLSSFSLKPLIQFNAVIVDFLDVDAWVIICRQTSLKHKTNRLNKTCSNHKLNISVSTDSLHK